MDTIFNTAQGVVHDTADWFGALGALALIVTVTVLLVRVVWPAWDLIARALYPNGLRHLQAVSRLAGLLRIGIESRSLYTAARLRIESELLNPLSQRPLRLEFHQEQEFERAAIRWRQDRKEWRRNIGAQLTDLVRSDKESRTVELDTCSPLINNDAAIRRYVDSLRAHGVPDADFFVSKVAIRSGFVAPLHLLTGVLVRYEEEWRPIVEAYGRSTIQVGDPFRYLAARKIQSYIFDCWLLWGPSIPICTCPEWYGEVSLQYGYGDEDNSLTLRCQSPGVIRVLGEDTGAITGPAVRASVTGTLRWGPALALQHISPAQQAIWRDSRLVLDITGDGSEIRRAGGTEEQVVSTYYSAYLWVILIMCRAEDGEPFHPAEKWRDMIPFFEHGNLGDGDVYDFHRDQLARKAVEGAAQLLVSDDRVTLRFVCSIDEPGCGYGLLYPVAPDRTIRSEMERTKTVFMGLPKASGSPSTPVLSRLITDVDPEDPWKDGDYSSCALPDIIQSYYNSGVSGVTFRDLNLARSADDDLLVRLYKEHYVSEFPDENERESLRNIRDCLRRKRKGGYGRNNYHVVVALNSDGDPVGGSIFDYLEVANVGVIEFIFVDPELRGSGLGRKLLMETELLLHQDAERVRGRGLDWIVAEVDDPYLSPSMIGVFDPFVRARVWHQWGYRLVDFPYIQPPLGPGLEPVKTLMLIAKKCGPLVARTESMSTTVLALTIRDYLIWAMRVKVPQEKPEYRGMLDFIEGAPGERIPLRDLVHYLGREDSTAVVANEVLDPADPELLGATDVYRSIFKDRSSAIDAVRLSDRVQSCLTSNRRYHLWALRAASEFECEGVASFFSLEGCGYGGYIGFMGRLRSTGRLASLVAQMEEQMVRDLSSSTPYSAPRGWYIECATRTEVKAFVRVGFYELDVPYFQPALDNSRESVAIRMHLLFRPFGRSYVVPPLSWHDVLGAVREIYRWVYDIEEPGTSSLYLELARAFKGDLNDLIDDQVKIASDGNPLTVRQIRR